MVWLWQVTGEVAPHRRAHHHPRAGAAAVDDRQVVLGDMLEGRVDLLLGRGQSEPGLDAAQLGPVRAQRGRASAREWAMPRAGGHQIDRAGLDRREGAERIAMVDRAGEQIGDGGEVDVRVRADVDAAAGRAAAPAPSGRRR